MEIIDAFDQHWHGVLKWWAPKASLGSRVLKKIMNKKAEGTFGLPDWHSTPFWSLLLDNKSFSNLS